MKKNELETMKSKTENDQAQAPPAQDNKENKEASAGGCLPRLVRRVSDVCGLDFFRIGCDLSAIDESNSKVMSVKRLKSELEGWPDDTDVCVRRENKKK